MKRSTAYCTALAGLIFLALPVRAQQTFSIVGLVTTNGTGLADVTVVLGGAQSDTTRTNATGEYTFDALPAGTYTVTPTREGYVFAPESFTITLPGTGTPVPVFDASMIATSTDGSPEIPTAVALEQNYPNPFNPETLIRYHLTDPGPVRLDVVDLLGRAVAILVNDTRRTGTYTVTFDASALPSGLYFYRLHTGSTVLARRMILAK